MARYTVIKFTNLSPVHIGTGNEAYEVSAAELQSDTISAALAALKASKGETDNLRDFLDSFTVSSAFPFIGDSYFLPRPQGLLDISVRGKQIHEYRKKLKKVKYVDFSIWSAIINGDHIDVDDGQLQGDFILKSASADFSKPYTTQVNQRVSVSRCGEDAEPFFFEWKFFQKDSGLFCLLSAQEKDMPELLSLFQALGETGVGTDKNVGGGKFDVETASIDIPDVQNADATMLLSSYIPTSDELPKLNLNQSIYSLSRRGGFMAGSTEPELMHLLKKEIYMFGCASVFRPSETIKGTTVDLRPDWNSPNMHPVYRSGRPITVPIKINDYE